MTRSAALAVTLTLVAGIGACVAYLSEASEADAFLDRQQRQMARYVGDLPFAMLARFAPEDVIAAPEDRISATMVEESMPPESWSTGRPALRATAAVTRARR